MLPYLLVCSSMKTVPRADPAHLLGPRDRQLHKTETPIEIPPEAVQEYMDIMDCLERLPQPLTREPMEKEEEESSGLEQEDDLHSDAGLLNYIDELCSQKHFVEQVSVILSPSMGFPVLVTEPASLPSELSLCLSVCLSVCLCLSLSVSLSRVCVCVCV